jgi:hypothetical protein
VVDRGLHAGPVDPQLPSLRDPGLPGHLGGALDEPMQGLGPQGVRPADQRRVVRRLLPEEAAEPAQHQALVHLVFRFLEAPVRQMLEQQHAQERLHRHGGSPERPGAGMALADVGSGRLIPLVIIEQGVQPTQDGVDAGGHLRHACEEVFCGVAIDQHAISSLPLLPSVLVSYHHSRRQAPGQVSLPPG